MPLELCLLRVLCVSAVSLAAGRPAAEPAPVATVATISHGTLVGVLSDVSEKGEVAVVTAAGGVARVPMAEVIRATLRPPDAPPRPETAGTLFLATGGRLRGRILASDKGGVTFESPLWGRAHVAFNRLLAYLPPRAPPAERPPEEGPEGARPDVPPAEILAGIGPGQAQEAAAQQDLVYLANGDRIPGVIEALTPGGVVVSGPLGRSEHAAETVVAVAFSRELVRRDPPETVCAVLTLTDGSVLAARIVSLSGGVFRLAAAADFDLTVKAEHVCRFAVRNGRALLLAEVEPARLTYVPYYSRVWPMRKDASVWGRPLTIGRRTFDSGLGLAPRTTLVYALDGRFDRLEAQAGIDDETNGKGNALLTVVTDGRRAVNLSLVGGQAAKPLNVPLAGIRELVITVDFGEDTDLGDHVDLGDAFLVRAKAD